MRRRDRVAFAYQVSRFGRQLRAARDDAPRLVRWGSRSTASGSSGSRCRARRRLRRRAVRPLPPDQRRRGVPRPTFVALAMLVIGGMTSLWAPSSARSRSPASTRCSRRPRTAPSGHRPAVGQSDDHHRRPHGDDADPAGRPASPAAREIRLRRLSRAWTSEGEDNMRVCVVGCGAVGLLVRRQSRPARRRRGMGVRSERTAR